MDERDNECDNECENEKVLAAASALDLQALNSAMAHVRKVDKLINTLSERSKAFTGLKRVGDQQLMLEALSDLSDMASELVAAVKELAEADNKIFKGENSYEPTQSVE